MNHVLTVWLMCFKVDLNHIYGSDLERQHKLRLHKDGKLKYQVRDETVAVQADRCFKSIFVAHSCFLSRRCWMETCTPQRLRKWVPRCTTRLMYQTLTASLLATRHSAWYPVSWCMPPSGSVSTTECVTCWRRSTQTGMTKDSSRPHGSFLLVSLQAVLRNLKKSLCYLQRNFQKHFL